LGYYPILYVRKNLNTPGEAQNIARLVNLLSAQVASRRKFLEQRLIVPVILFCHRVNSIRVFASTRVFGSTSDNSMLFLWSEIPVVGYS